MFKARSTILLAAAFALLAPWAARSGQYLDIQISADDRAVSSSENLHDLPQSGGENPSSETLEELILWIADNTDYDVAYTMQSPPQIRFTSTGESINYERKDITVDRELIAVYDRIDRIIYLVRPWDSYNPENLSRLLHELIHDVQFHNVDWPCMQKPEWEAYKLQAKWLTEHGVEKEFDWSKIFLISQCPEDILPMTRSPGGTGRNAQRAVQCESPLIKISASDARLAAEVCKIAAKADVEFAQLGLTNTRTIFIHISEEIDLASGHWAALAHLDNDIVEVPSLHRLKVGPASRGPFPMLSAPVLFESLIVHELAHVHINQMARGRFVSRLAHEYLAYALQLNQLSEHERGLILEEANISGPVEIGDFHEALLSFSPLRYAAMAWSHFGRQKDRAEFARSIIEGKVIFQSLRE